MSGKVKSLHGVYKALGRDAFLAAAKMYSDHVQKTVEATLAEMESHWYGAEKTMTEADRMVSDFQIGYLTRESAEGLLAQERLQEKFAKNMNAVLNNVHFVRLECSCMQPPSPEYRKNWQGGHLNARSSRLEPKRSKANTPASMR